MRLENPPNGVHGASTNASFGGTALPMARARRRRCVSREILSVTSKAR
jgi:hypothetical protein